MVPRPADEPAAPAGGGGWLASVRSHEPTDEPARPDPPALSVGRARSSVMAWPGAVKTLASSRRFFSHVPVGALQASGEVHLQSDGGGPSPWGGGFQPRPLATSSESQGGCPP